MRKIKFIDLFAGIGGFHKAMEIVAKNNNYDIECVFVSEIDPYAIKTYLNNFLINEEKIINIKDLDDSSSQVPDHDALFDKLLITFNINGKLIPSKIIVDKINSDFNLSDSEKVINIDNSNVIEYLKIHNKEFLGIKWKLNHTRK